jgi:hypothetical protein
MANNFKTFSMTRTVTTCHRMWKVGHSAQKVID